ncbi:MAG: hypothetical protein IFK94_05490 [Acidobacteria bacterium]|uniref:Uncharacterized protein n=1 Tax=Candidatus Polarisedimenticola svalbardensis TaxID=2886004 RepID=A0A8J7CE15_9BACT|nr:hypothetical protein [Candidatus Polarisedimenticola svalbardensis]
MNQLISLASRVLFFGALLMAVVAMGEKAANVMSMTVLRGLVQPSRLLELAAIALLFVVAMQLREMKEALEAGKR